MADDNSNQNPEESDASASAIGTQQDQKGVSGDKGQADAVALAEKVGKLEAENEALKEYQAKVDPVIQTIWSDEQTLKQVTAVHNKRLGVSPPDESKKDEKIAVTPPSPTEIDNRNAHIKNIVDNFSTTHKINELKEEDRKILNTKIGVELQEMLDPMGNKTLQQIMETVSVTKLPQYLEKAYTLATRDQQLKEAEERGKRQATEGSAGMIGSIPSSTIEPSEVALSAKEKEIAKKIGVSEEKYLERKKEILARDGQLF